LTAVSFIKDDQYASAQLILTSKKKQPPTEELQNQIVLIMLQLRY
jgi:hypothetical protein